MSTTASENNNREDSIYYKNWIGQKQEWMNILSNSPLPSDLLEFLKNTPPKRTIFVGIGSSFWASQLSDSLWREHASMDAIAIHSYDFANSKYFLDSRDLVVVFSHRGTKGFSVDSIKKAKMYGCKVVFITGIGGAQHDVDFRLETCVQETIGAFTVSLTTALVRVIQMISVYNQSFLQKFKDFISGLQLPFIISRLPLFLQKLTLLGLPVAAEIALKIAEMAYLPVRSLGIEEFLHGPRISSDKESSIVLFTSKEEKRRMAVIKFLEVIGSDLIVIEHEQLTNVKEFGWLALLLWGQGLSLKICVQLHIDPDTCRNDDPVYFKAKQEFTL